MDHIGGDGRVWFADELIQYESEWIAQARVPAGHKRLNALLDD